MIKFCCSHCGQEINVPEIHTGKKGKCPKCKNMVVIPEAEPVGSIDNQVKQNNTKHPRSSSSVSHTGEEQKATSQSMQCSDCGFSNIENASFCSNCGKELVTEIICDNCDAKLDPNTKFCGECGAQQPMNVGRRGQETENTEFTEKAKYKNADKLIFPDGKRKSPGLAVFLSFLISGLGQIYLGQIGFAIILFIFGIVAGSGTAGVAYIILWILSMIWAYRDAERLNNGKNSSYEPQKHPCQII